jgi:hypothetical protein
MRMDASDGEEARKAVLLFSPLTLFLSWVRQGWVAQRNGRTFTQGYRSIRVTPKSKKKCAVSTPL